MKGNAFSRAIGMFRLIAAAMSMHAESDRQMALGAIPAYESRGKGGGGRPKSARKVAMDKRAAKKTRNVRRHRMACRH